MSSGPSICRFDRALCRRPGRSVTAGLRAGGQDDPRFDIVVAEHEAYVSALREAGVVVDMLDPLEAFPDSVFVEDPALVFTEGAVLLRPGAASRVGEADALAPALHARMPKVIGLPRGTADGGDVLATPDVVMIGLSARTNREGAEALAACLSVLGRKAVIADTPAGVLHFKSDCSLLDDATVLVTARLAASGVFEHMRQIIVPEGEEAGANALRVNDVVLAGQSYPRTIEHLRRHGYTVVPLPVAEVGKIDAGLSCMSLRWRGRVEDATHGIVP